MKWLIVGLNLEQKRQGNINLKNIEGAEREDIQGEQRNVTNEQSHCTVSGKLYDRGYIQ